LPATNALRLCKGSDLSAVAHRAKADSDEAIQLRYARKMDCFASLAMMK
jgi:hypothetical protein